MVGETFIVRDAVGLSKFRKGDEVIVASDVSTDGNVKVYKTDDCGDILLNENGNKVKYTIAFARLKPEYADTRARDNAGIIEDRVIKKTFNDKALDEAANYVSKSEEFVASIDRLRKKLDSIAKKVMGKTGELHVSADTYDTKSFGKAMADMKSINKFLDSNDKVKAIVKFADDLAPDSDEEYDVEDLLA